MHAVVQIGSSQYIVAPEQEFLVTRLPGQAGNLNLEKVLLIIDGENIHVGQPFVKDFQVTAEILGEQKGDKVRISTFKAKSRFNKTRGFRPVFSKIKISGISKTPPKQVKKRVVKEKVDNREKKS